MMLSLLVLALWDLLPYGESHRNVLEYWGLKHPLPVNTLDHLKAHQESFDVRIRKVKNTFQCLTMRTSYGTNWSV